MVIDDHGALRRLDRVARHVAEEGALRQPSPQHRTIDRRSMLHNGDGLRPDHQGGLAGDAPGSDRYSHVPDANAVGCRHLGIDEVCQAHELSDIARG